MSWSFSDGGALVGCWGLCCLRCVNLPLYVPRVRLTALRNHLWFGRSCVTVRLVQLPAKPRWGQQLSSGEAQAWAKGGTSLWFSAEAQCFPELLVPIHETRRVACSL